MVNTSEDECVFDSGGRCAACGYVAAIAGIRRKCRPLFVEKKVSAFVDPPTLADLHFLESANTRKTSFGLGDMVALSLAAVGITKERVSKAVGSDCGCAARQQAMNEWGRKNLGIG